MKVADNEITVMNQKYLGAMRVWVQEKEMLNIDICAADFNITITKEYIVKMHKKEEIDKDTDYGKDNHCMFQIFKGLVLNHSAYAWIQLQGAANDGRGAWKSLTAY